MEEAEGSGLACGGDGDEDGAPARSSGAISRSSNAVTRAGTTSETRRMGANEEPIIISFKRRGDGRDEDAMDTTIKMGSR